MFGTTPGSATRTQRSAPGQPTGARRGVVNRLSAQASAWPGQTVAKTSDSRPASIPVRSHARRPGAAAYAELRSAAAHRRAVADRTQRVDGIGEVGDSRVPVHRRTVGAHSRVVVDRSWEVDRSRVATATHKRAAAAHNPAMADRSWEVGRTRVATDKRAAAAHNQVAVRPCPGRRCDEEMLAALRWRQSLRKDGA